jgi:hypothetical protein
MLPMSGLWMPPIQLPHRPTYRGRNRRRQAADAHPAPVSVALAIPPGLLDVPDLLRVYGRPGLLGGFPNHIGDAHRCPAIVAFTPGACLFRELNVHINRGLSQVWSHRIVKANSQVRLGVISPALVEAFHHVNRPFAVKAFFREKLDHRRDAGVILRGNPGQELDLADQRAEVAWCPETVVVARRIPTIKRYYFLASYPERFMHTEARAVERFTSDAAKGTLWLEERLAIPAASGARGIAKLRPSLTEKTRLVIEELAKEGADPKYAGWSVSDVYIPNSACRHSGRVRVYRLRKTNTDHFGNRIRIQPLPPSRSARKLPESFQPPNCCACELNTSSQCPPSPARLTP